MMILFWSLLFLSLASSCSRPIKPKSEFMTIELGDRTFTRYFDLLEKVNYEGSECISLADFVDSVVTVYPQMYAYRIFGSDGYYPAKKGVPDNVWEHMQNGCLNLSTRGVVFDPSLGLPRKYHVSDVVSIELLRKIDVGFKGDESFSFCLVNDMNFATYLDSTDAFYHGRSGVRLSEFVQTLTSTPEDYTYTLISAEGEEKAFSWSEIRTGWWLSDLDLTKFYPDLGSDSRMRHLHTIQLTPKSG